MDSSTLLWTVDATRGSVNFGRLIPFAGNTYELVFAGVALEEVYTAYVMDESGLKCLAKSEHNAGEYTIAFNTSELRGEFERNMHEVQTFHVIVRDSKRVVAEGDLSVQWQSLWEDTTTGEVFTMKGEPGRPGNPGRPGDQGEPGKNAYEVALDNGFDGTVEEWLASLKGAPGSATMAYCEEDGKWYDFTIAYNEFGERVIRISQVGKNFDADTSSYVSRTEKQTVMGQKTFTVSPLVPDIGTTVDGEFKRDVDDNSDKTVSTKFLKAWWNHVKNLFIEAEEHIWNCLQTFKVAPVIKIDAIDLSATVQNDATYIVSELQDVQGTAVVESDFTQRADGAWNYNPGRVVRKFGNVEKVCGIEHQIDGDGTRIIKLDKADVVIAPEVDDPSDNSNKVATTSFVQSALGALAVGDSLVAISEFNDLTTSARDKIISGLKANKSYFVVCMWSCNATGHSLTIAGVNGGEGRGLHCISGNATSKADGTITLSMKTSNTSYITSVIVFVYERRDNV